MATITFSAKPFCPPLTLLRRDFTSSQLRLSFVKPRLNATSRRYLLSVSCCCDKSKDTSGPIIPDKQDRLKVALAPFLKRWDVPWKWHSILSTILGCLVCQFVEFPKIRGMELGLNGLAGSILAEASVEVAATLGVIYTLYKCYTHSDDFFCFDWREPFDLRKGWLLWAGIGTVVDVISHISTHSVLSKFGYLTRHKETDPSVLLLLLIGYSKISTTCVLAYAGLLVAVAEETLCRGFLIVAMTKWMPTPMAILISAAIFSLAHFPSSFLPHHFVAGIVLGCSYAKTRNLLTFEKSTMYAP